MIPTPDITEPQPRKVAIVGVLGGIGSGKSYVAREASAHMNGTARVIDGDAVGHQVLQEPRIRQQLTAAFGNEILQPDGTVNRKALAAKVFGSGESVVAHRHCLEAIVHPAIQSTFIDQIEEADQQGQSVVLLDAAVLLEAGWQDLCDRLVFIDTDPAIRAERVATRGWSVEELRKREQSQWPLDHKQALADVVIANHSPADDAPGVLAKWLQNPANLRRKRLETGSGFPLTKQLLPS